MPKPICCECGLEMKCTKIGVVVVFTAYDPPDFYYTQNSDKYECATCGATVLSGFGDKHYYNNTRHTLVSELARMEGSEYVLVKERWTSDLGALQREIATARAATMKAHGYTPPPTPTPPIAAAQ